jgi:hypothetical protein
VSYFEITSHHQQPPVHRLLAPARPTIDQPGTNLRRISFRRIAGTTCSILLVTCTLLVYAGIVSSTAVKTKHNMQVSRETMNMTTGSLVLFHIGPHKTGSTSIQAAINSQSFQNSLLMDKFVVGNVGPGGMTTKAELVGCFQNEQSCIGDSNNVIMKQMGKALTEDIGIIFSSEQFDYTRGYLNEMKHFFREFSDVQIILTYRRFFEWSISWFMQSKRNGWDKWVHRKMGTGEHYHPNLSSYATSTTRYTINPYMYYKDHFNVTLINMHAGNDDSLDNFFCNPVVNTPRTCKLRQLNELQIIYKI